MGASNTGLPRLVLFVDSDGGWAVATGAGLKARGWSVVWASAAETAVPAVRQTLPDVIVLDAQVDGGAEHVLRHVRAGSATALIPAVALCRDDGQAAVLRAAGAQSCLRKPVDVDALEAAVREALEVPVELAGPPVEVLGNAGRLQLLHASGLLGSDDCAVFDALTGLATGLFDVRSARVTLVSDTAQLFKSRTDRPRDGAAERSSTPLSHSLCQWPVACCEPLVVSDARADPLLATSGAVTEHATVAYLGAPLIVDGYALGTLCVVEEEPREWDPDDLDLLEDLAAAAVAEIRLRLAAAGVADAGRAAGEAVEALADVQRRHGGRMGEGERSALATLHEHFARHRPEE